jgi:hypothetical protein
MAAITITGGLYVNHDDNFCTGLLNGEAYTINEGSTLLFNSDPQWSRHGQFPGNITINDGKVIIDGTKVRNIYFSASSGTVPPLNTYLTGLSSNATGQIIYTGARFNNVFNTGFFKIREQFGNFINNEQIRAGAWSGVLSGNSQTGWLCFVGTEAAGFVTSRNGSVIVSGAWYNLGRSNGNANQVLNHYCQEPLPVVWVERTSGSNTYDRYLNAGTRWPLGVSSGERGYWFRHSGNLVTGATDILFGSNNAASPARIPNSGCNIRVPNVHFASTRTANWGSSGETFVNSTLATRYDFTTTSAGDISLDKCIGGGFYLNTAQAVNVDLNSVGMFDNITATETANRLTIKDVGVALYEANDNLPLTIATIAAPVIISGISVAHRDIGAENSTTFTNCLNVVGQDLYLYGLRSNASANLLLITSCDSVTLTGLELVGARASIVSSNNIKLYNTQFHDKASGIQDTALAQSLFEINTRSTNITIDGLSGLEGSLTTYPRTALVNIANSSFINLRNFGDTGNFLNSNSNTTYIYSIGTQTTDVNLNKIYFLNTVTNHHLDVNDCTRIKATNVWGDTGDSNIILALNSQNRGCLCGVLPIGQTAVYGTHFYDVFDSAASGKIGIFFNEKTTDSVSTDAYTTSGSSKFNSLGGLLLLNSGTDSIDYTWPHFILGYSGFMNVSGRGFYSAGTNLLNAHTYQYDLNTGLGFTNTFRDISGNLTGHRFSPTIGVKPKFRFICKSGSQSNVLNGFYVQGMTSYNAALSATYPVESIAASLNLTNLVTGTEIRVFKTADDTELAGVEDSSTTFTYNYTWEGSDTNAYIAVHSLGYVPIRYTSQILGRNGLNIEVQQQRDRVYENL